MTRYLLSQLAEVDLAEIHSYVGADRPSAAEKLLHRIFRSFGTLAAQPELGERRSDLMPGLRTFAVKGYIICYALIDNGIEIARVVHAARDLDAIMKRD